MEGAFQVAVQVEFRLQAQQLQESLAALFPKGTRFPEQAFPPQGLMSSIPQWEQRHRGVK